MKTNTIGAWIFSAVLAVIAALNAPVVSDRVNGWLGKDAAPPAPIQQLAQSPDTAEPATEPATDEPEPAAEAGNEEVASLPQETLDGQAPAAETAGESSGETGPSVERRAAPPVTIPSFGLLRVEPDGSTVIAGQAAPDAMIEILSGDEKIAQAKAEANGDFVAVLDTPLKPGDYEIVLRATEPSGDVAMSAETAIVAVPEKGKENELLALVERPGEPSRLINTPKLAEPEPQAESAATQTAGQESAGEAPEPAEETGEAAAQAARSEVETGAETEVAAVAEPAVTVAEEPAPGRVDVRIEAVEIDGSNIYVAGAARAGAQVRVYANEILLGDTIAGPNGRFLVEVERELPVGDYIIRADVIDPATAEVVARAAVPFTRSEGERLAAVATTQAPAEETVASAENAQGEVALSEPSAALPENPPEISAPVTVTGTLRRTDSSVIIRRGDTLWHISRRIYGEGVRYTTIYLANQQQIENPDLIWPGQIFSLPENSDG